jgi:hypothetical protein
MPENELQIRARKALSRIVNFLIGDDKPNEWFVQAILRENRFVTMRDTREILYYNGSIYVRPGDKRKVTYVMPCSDRSKRSSISSRDRNT